ncbi:BgTH12-04316 [Blumeria graminis f. sp. triticale]|uniref:BgTH12-04316 n=1 Tax=Blumeria graminis f. sp. triticale TaxID=1689686 RepID=A0A9W4CU85_BLUGR|nr:BgTH12-04316 [Blumeria graminis f. sp. triticale]
MCSLESQISGMCFSKGKFDPRRLPAFGSVTKLTKKLKNAKDSHQTRK